jgi:RHS repeat-associated protein
MIKKTTPEGVVNFTYDDIDRLTEIEAPDFHYKYAYGLIPSNNDTILQEENLKNGLWSQYINNQHGLPREYYDNFEWKKTYWYNFSQSGGTPIDSTPYLVTYTKRWEYGEYRMHYTYDKGNRLTIRKNQYLNTQKNFTYDNNGVLSQLMYSGPTAFPDIDINFTRDDSGLITSITGDKELNVTYNPDLEIESVQHILQQPFDESYTYDTRGNRLTSLTHSYTYNDLNQLTDSTTHTYSYDADGNLIEEKNKITTETKKYYYNSENRLIIYEHYPNDVSQADTSATYNYDIYGRRLQKNVNGTILNFTWEGDNLAMELDENLQPIRRYVYGIGIDDVEGYVELSEVTGGMFEQFKQGWYSYVKDHVGTIYKVYSDYTQQIVETRNYDVFGNMVNQTGSSTDNLGFHSKYYDQESGLNYFYHRYYNPFNGRFINEDLIGLDGGLNCYRFVNNNPIKWIDPYGLIFTDEHPNWMRRFCLLWKNVAKVGGQELGSWLFHNDEVDTWENRWKTPPGQKNMCKPPRPYPSKSKIAGSCHTHPIGKSRKASVPEDTDVADEWHPEGTMYIISIHGIWGYSGGSHFKVLSWKEFKKWCKCKGYW